MQAASVGIQPQGGGGGQSRGDGTSYDFALVVYDLDGNSVASAIRPTEKVTPPGHPEWVEWDPDQIWNGAAAAAKEAISQLDDASLIRGVAVTGMGMDGVPVDLKVDLDGGFLRGEEVDDGGDLGIAPAQGSEHQGENRAPAGVLA